MIGCVVHNPHCTTLTPLHHFEIHYTKDPSACRVAPNATNCTNCTEPNRPVTQRTCSKNTTPLMQTRNGMWTRLCLQCVCATTTTTVVCQRSRRYREKPRNRCTGPHSRQPQWKFTVSHCNGTNRIGSI